MKISIYESAGWVLWPAVSLELGKNSALVYIGWLKWFIEFAWAKRRCKI